MLVTDCAGHFDAETLGVLPHLVCELSALDALGEPWVVVDSLSDSCLSSNTATLDNQCFNSFTRRIHRRREAGRATADHDQIVERLGSLRVDSQLRSQLSIAWFNQNRTILEKNDCRDDLLTIVGVLDVLASGLVLTNVHQLSRTRCSPKNCLDLAQSRHHGAPYTVILASIIVTIPPLKND